MLRPSKQREKGLLETAGSFLVAHLASFLDWIYFDEILAGPQLVCVSLSKGVTAYMDKTLPIEVSQFFKGSLHTRLIPWIPNPFVLHRRSVWREAAWERSLRAFPEPSPSVFPAALRAVWTEQRESQRDWTDQRVFETDLRALTRKFPISRSMIDFISDLRSDDKWSDEDLGMRDVEVAKLCGAQENDEFLCTLALWRCHARHPPFGRLTLSSNSSKIEHARRSSHVTHVFEMATQIFTKSSTATTLPPSLAQNWQEMILDFLYFDEMTAARVNREWNQRVGSYMEPSLAALVQNYPELGTWEWAFVGYRSSSREWERDQARFFEDMRSLTRHFPVPQIVLDCVWILFMDHTRLVRTVLRQSFLDELLEAAAHSPNVELCLDLWRQLTDPKFNLWTGMRQGAVVELLAKVRLHRTLALLSRPTSVAVEIYDTLRRDCRVSPDERENLTCTLGTRVTFVSMFPKARSSWVKDDFYGPRVELASAHLTQGSSEEWSQACQWFLTQLRSNLPRTSTIVSAWPDWINYLGTIERVSDVIHGLPDKFKAIFERDRLGTSHLAEATASISGERSIQGSSFAYWQPFLAFAAFEEWESAIDMFTRGFNTRCHGYFAHDPDYEPTQRDGATKYCENSWTLWLEQLHVAAVLANTPVDRFVETVTTRMGEKEVFSQATVAKLVEIVREDVSGAIHWDTRCGDECLQLAPATLWWHVSIVVHDAVQHMWPRVWEPMWWHEWLHSLSP